MWWLQCARSSSGKLRRRGASRGCPMHVDTCRGGGRLVGPAPRPAGRPVSPHSHNHTPTTHTHTTMAAFDSLLTAARLLEAQPALFLDQAELRDLITGKIRAVKRSSPSTSASPYHVDAQPTPSSSRRSSSTKHSRAAHNELEKTRRANLRTCLDTLKAMVPPGTDAARNTTLALLTRARDHIRYLDSLNKEKADEKARLQERQLELRAELTRLRARQSPSSPAAVEETCTPPVVPSTPSSSSSTSSSHAATPRDSPVFLEYSPLCKPEPSPLRQLVRDPMAEGLLPAWPICFPRPSSYPYDLPMAPAHLAV